MAAVDAGARAHVDEKIGLAYGVFVVLDDEHGIAERFQASKRAEQAFVVALVQADGGLVENVEHAGEAGADLAREPYALALAARQGSGSSRQAQIVEADIDEELQALDDFTQDAAGDFEPLRGKRGADLGEPGERVVYREFRGLRNILPTDANCECFRF